MNNNPNQPRKYDAVKGGQTPPPVAGVVLGGIEGVKRRLTNPVAEVRIAALCEALNYGEAGLDLVIGALNDSTKQVQYSASRLLREKGGIKGKEALIDYDPWLFFTKWENWKVEEFNPKVGITEPVDTAYVVKDKNQLQALLQDRQANKIEALKCEIDDGCWYRRRDFGDFVNAFVEAGEQLPSLKALFIGEPDNYSLGRSEIYIYNNIPLLIKTYPKLELLHLRGRIVDNNFRKPHPNLNIVKIRNRTNNSFLAIRPLKHTYLKTLIVESTDISDSNLAQICNLDLPSLEYIELWLGKSDSGKGTIDSLTPALLGKSFPKLAYLGLIGSQNTNTIAQAVASSLIIGSLKVLDLSRGNLSDAGAIALLKEPAINWLHTLKVSNNSLSTSMIGRLSQLNCRVIWEPENNLDEYEDDEDDLYRYETRWE